MSNKLPTGFLAMPPETCLIGLPEDGAKDEKGELKTTVTTLSSLYLETLARLREDHPDVGTAELMLMERIAFLFMWMKFLETKNFKANNDYRDVMKLWSSLVSDLAKITAKNPEEVREAVLSKVSSAVASAVNTLPVDIRSDVENSINTSFDEAGL